MILAKYDSYKDSEVEWLGEIPESWKVKRVKEIFSEFGSGSTPKAGNPHYHEGGEINWLNTADLNNSDVCETKQKITELAVKDYSLRTFSEDSIVMAMYGQGKTRGMVGLLKIKTTTNQASCVMFGIKRAHLRFILWSLISKYDVMRSINTGTTQPNMNQDFIRNTCLIIPYSKQEQIQISNFLDKKTSQIDKKIKVLQDKKTSYIELKKSLINESVCRGLDKNVKLKNSGIEWVVKIPKHWKLKRIKDCFFNVKEKSYDRNPVILSLTQKGIIKRDMSTNKGQLASTYEGYIKIKRGDIVLNSMDLISGFVDSSKIEGVISPAYSTIRAKKNAIPNYYNYYFQKHYYEKIFFPFGKGVSIENRWTLNNQTLLSFSILYPPKDEQIKIANYLDEKTSKIDKIIKKINNQISTLTVFRKTLINDVVTGKIKVAE